MPPFELEQLTFNPSQQGSMLIGSGDLLPARSLRASLILHYQHDPLKILREGGSQSSVVKNRLTAHLQAAFGITKWLEVGLQLPIVIFQRGDRIAELAPVEPVAVGTPSLQARVGLLSEEKKQPIDLGFELGIGLPVGNSLAFTRNQTVSATPRVGAGRTFGLIRVAASLGALLRGGTVLSPASTTVNDEIGSSLQLGASATTTNKGLRGEVTLLGFVPFTRSGGSAELLLGARYPVGPVEIFALGGPGFGKQPGTPAYRLMAGVGLSLPNSKCVAGAAHEPADCPQLDLDLDGVINADDLCPREPGLPVHGGCPDPDPDHDGVLGVADKCPDVAGLKDNGGCPPPPDSDDDGLIDAKDKCPDKAGPRENNGCPWPDTDGDAVLDKDDGCPSEMGPVENKGCPWPDTDGDGIVDPQDACPTEPGLADRKGCPVRDADADTVPDEIDNCPKVKGDPANQGCPKAVRQLVVITREKLDIKEKVFFDTGKATIKAKSFGLLDQVASVLKEHPEIPKISIEGHTDNVGKPEANRILSQKRAESVRDYIVKQGIAPDRLDAKGFGPDRPADTNDTAAGKENNRRVEFVVIAPPEKSDVHEVVP